MRRGNQNYRPFRLCLAIGDDLVASKHHYRSLDEANAVRTKLLASPTFRARPEEVRGVRVMHFSTFKRIVSEGGGCEMSTLQENARRFGKDFCRQSKLYNVVETLTYLLSEDFKK